MGGSVHTPSRLEMRLAARSSCRVAVAAGADWFTMDFHSDRSVGPQSILCVSWILMEVPLRSIRCRSLILAVWCLQLPTRLDSSLVVRNGRKQMHALRLGSGYGWLLR